MASVKHRIIESGLSFGLAVILLTQSVRNEELPLWMASVGLATGLILMMHGLKLWSLRYRISSTGIHVTMGLRERKIDFHQIRKASYMTLAQNRAIILEFDVLGRRKRCKIPIDLLSDSDRAEFKQALETRVERAFPKRHGFTRRTF